MARKCKCCTRETTGNKCSYCNYINVEILDNSRLDEENERVIQYKKMLLNKISDFTINAYTYKWNNLTSRLDTDRAMIKIIDSISEFNKVVWCEQPFGQNLDDDKKERPISISYKFDGKNRDINVVLKTIRCDDFWKLGVMINQDLTISFCLGTKNNNILSGPYDLDFD